MSFCHARKTNFDGEQKKTGDKSYKNMNTLRLNKTVLCLIFVAIIS